MSNQELPNNDYPRSYVCNHWHAHTIVLHNLTDAWADFILRQGGWYDSGWCFEVLPSGVREAAYEKAANLVGLRNYFDKVANHA